MSRENVKIIQKIDTSQQTCIGVHVYFVTNYLQKIFTDLTLQFLKNNNFFNYTYHTKTIILVFSIESRYHETRKKTFQKIQNTTHCPAMWNVLYIAIYKQDFILVFSASVPNSVFNVTTFFHDCKYWDPMRYF